MKLSLEHVDGTTEQYDVGYTAGKAVMDVIEVTKIGPGGSADLYLMDEEGLIVDDVMGVDPVRVGLALEALFTNELLERN